MDIAIPGNDDAMRTVELLLKELADAVEQGRTAQPTEQDKVVARRASTRSPTTARADGSDGPTLTAEDEVMAPPEAQASS